MERLVTSRLPIKEKEPNITQTPPLNKLASIPFIWEEAPGKPRSNIAKTPAARCLDLPPRLLNVDDGPCSFTTCQSLSRPPLLPPSFLLSKGSYNSFVSLVEEIDRDEGKDESKRLKLGSSWSWGSFKGRSRIACKAVASMRSYKSSVKICRVRRRSSFLRISQASSNLLAGVYGSFKQVVPWRWRQQQ